MRFLFAMTLLAGLAGAAPCWADEDDPAAAAARRAAVFAMRQERRMTAQIRALATEYQQTGDVRIAIELRGLVLIFARDCPNTPLGRFLRVGPLP
jgi:hypothetical protein